MFLFLFVCFLLSLEAIEAYKLHTLREWTKSVGGKGESIWNGMKIKPFWRNNTTQPLNDIALQNWLREINNEIRRGAE